MSREEDYPEDDDDYDYDYEDDYEDEDREEEVLASSDEDEDEDDEDEDEQEERSSDAVFPTSASPYMVMQHGKDETEQTFYSISKGSYFDTSIPEMYGSICCASSNGWLVMLDSSSDSSNRFCFLLNSVSLEIIDLPSIKIPSYEFDYCILTSSPPDCVVMFLSEKENSCIFCRPNNRRWTRKILGRKPERGGSGYFQVIFGAVSCEGKIYINYGTRPGQGMKILDYKDEDSRIIGNRFTVEKLKLNKGGLSLDSFLSESSICLYLVESCAEVFLVVKIYIGSSMDSNTYSFNVYKLMTSSSTSGRRRMTWKKVETLGNDRVFFVAQSGTLSVSASKAGLKENYIYFFHHRDPRYLYRFSMDTGSIYKTPSFSHVTDVNPICMHNPCWMVSNSIL